MDMSDKSLINQGITPELFFDEKMGLELQNEVAQSVKTQDDLWILAQLLMESSILPEESAPEGR